MLYDALSRASLEIDEQIEGRPELYEQHAEALRALQDHIHETLEALAKRNR